MRIKYTIKNSLYAIVSFSLLSVLSLIARKVFLSSVQLAYLGYEGLFGNIFSLLSLADMGIETVILYKLFPAVVAKDEKRINEYMKAYKYFNAFIGLIVIIIGILIIPFLKYIIKGNALEWKYVYLIYLVHLTISVSTYLLAYNRIAFVVNMREYECIKVDTFVSLFFIVIKIILLKATNNYFYYLACGLLSNIISNYLIFKKARIDYPDYTKFEKKKGGVRFTVFDQVFKKNIKNNFVHKICGVIYGGTDNLLVSITLGIEKVAILANYVLIQGFVTTFLTKLLNPLQASIGNYIYSSSPIEKNKMFRMFDYFGFVIASFVSACYLCMFKPFIMIWIGGEYVLEDLFTMAFCVNQYIEWNHIFLVYYRASLGYYEKDRNPIIIASVLNIVFSIVLGKKLGISGIMIGTVIGHFGFWYGRSKVVYYAYISESIIKYWVRQFFRICIVISEWCIIYYISSFIQVSILGLLIRVLICFTTVLVVNLLVFCKTEELAMLVEYIKKTKKVLKG